MSIKDTFEQKLEEQLRDWNEQIGKLKARAEKVESDAQLAYYKEIEALRERQEKVRQQLHDLRHSSESAWASVKAGVEKSRDDMEQAVKKALDRF